MRSSTLDWWQLMPTRKCLIETVLTWTFVYICFDVIVHLQPKWFPISERLENRPYFSASPSSSWSSRFLPSKTWMKSCKSWRRRTRATRKWPTASRTKFDLLCPKLATLKVFKVCVMINDWNCVKGVQYCVRNIDAQGLKTYVEGPWALCQNIRGRVYKLVTRKRYTIAFKFSSYSIEGVYRQNFVIDLQYTAWFSFSRLNSLTRMGSIMNTGLVACKVEFSYSKSVIGYLFPCF